MMKTFILIVLFFSFFLGEIFTFNLPVSNSIMDFAALNNVMIYQDNVIYRLFENLISSLTRQLPKLQEEEIIGMKHIYIYIYLHHFRFFKTLYHNRKAVIAFIDCD